MKQEEKIKEGQSHKSECDLLYSTTSHMLTTETCGCAAGMMILYRLKSKSYLGEDAELALRLAEEDFLAGQSMDWERRNVRLWEILEYLVKWVGGKEFTAATIEVISIISDDTRFDIKSREGLTLVEEMEMIINFARTCVK